jgi:hypothetical protein
VEGGALRYARSLLTRPGQWPEAIRAGWAMRRGRWWAKPPFLPLPERDYVSWRAATAYGSEQTDATAQDLVSYLGWRKRLRRVGQ